jgi:hypothetical protein
VTDPEPAVVPVKITEQVPPDSEQVAGLNDPPVVPAVSVKVTVPPGVFVGVVVSVTVAVAEAVQLVPPNAMVQLTLATDVVVVSFAATVMSTVVGVVVAPNGVPVTWSEYEPGATVEATSIVKTLVEDGVTEVGLNDAQVMPVGRGVTQDNATDSVVPAVRVAVIVTVPEFP